MAVSDGGRSQLPVTDHVGFRGRQERVKKQLQEIGGYIDKNEHSDGAVERRETHGKGASATTAVSPAAPA
jgi:hypothetical protein